jgi:hypothetical protein
MEAGTLGEQISPWGAEMFRTLKTVQPETASEQAAYGKWLDQTSAREQARLERVHGALGVIPTPLWVILGVVFAVIVVYMLFFADSGERAVVQALLRERTTSMQRERGARARAMSDQAGNGRARGAPKRDWVEIIATLLLALAAVATAWSSYQASRWNGEQALAASRTNAIRIQAARAASLAEAEAQVDVATFVQWVNADASKDTALADFYRSRFREEFRPAFRAWLATSPYENPDAPLTPFAMPEYRVAARADTERLDRAAEEAAASVATNLQRATNYVLGVVLFAVALFFAGISTKLRTPALRKALLVLGSLLFTGTVAWIATFPVNVSV